MVEHLDAEQLLERGLDLLNARVAKLDDFTGVGEDHVVVLLDAVTLSRTGSPCPQTDACAPNCNR